MMNWQLRPTIGTLVRTGSRFRPRLALPVEWPAVMLALLLAVAALLPVVPLQALQLYAADMLFLWKGGPGLGRQPVDPSLVLVLQDQKTYDELSANGWPPTTDEDLALYRILLADGVRAVGDSRPIFTAQSDAQRFLDRLIALDPRGRVLRSIVFDSNTEWFARDQRRYLPHVGPDPFVYNAGFDVTQRIRYYPLLVYNPAAGFDEALALKIARAALGLPAPTDVSELIRATGIAAAWVAATRLSPAALPKSLSTVTRRYSPYPFGPDRALPWVIAPATDAPFITSPAALWIDYVAPPGSYPTLSYVDVLQGRIPPPQLRGKVVLIGNSPVILETYPVPTAPSQRAAVAEIVAAVEQTILDRRFLVPEPLPLVILAVLALGLGGGAIVRRTRPLRAILGLFGVLVLYMACAVWLYRRGIVPDLILGPGALLGAGLIGGGFRFIREERARRQVTDLFGRYVPRSVVAVLVQRPERALALGGEKREVTVLFADIRGFTAFSEPLPPEQVLSALNALLQAVVARIFEHQGTIDKYIGDAVMVLFNAPLDQPDHAVRAVRAARAMQEAVEAVGGDLALGIGIHTGEAVVGNVGTPDRLEYTAIGRTVNLAARLCETAGKGEIILSAETYARAADAVTAEPRPPLRVKGIDRELITYRVLTGQG